jgi:hypothetical protein
MALFSIGQFPICVVSYVVDIYDIMMMEKNGVINLWDKSLFNVLILCLLLMKYFYFYFERLLCGFRRISVRLLKNLYSCMQSTFNMTKH